MRILIVIFVLAVFLDVREPTDPKFKPILRNWSVPHRDVMDRDMLLAIIRRTGPCLDVPGQTNQKANHGTGKTLNHSGKKGIRYSSERLRRW